MFDILNPSDPRTFAQMTEVRITAEGEPAIYREDVRTALALIFAAIPSDFDEECLANDEPGSWLVPVPLDLIHDAESAPDGEWASTVAALDTESIGAERLYSISFVWPKV